MFPKPAAKSVMAFAGWLPVNVIYLLSKLQFLFFIVGEGNEERKELEN